MGAASAGDLTVAPAGSERRADTGTLFLTYKHTNAVGEMRRTGRSAAQKHLKDRFALCWLWIWIYAVAQGPGARDTARMLRKRSACDRSRVAGHGLGPGRLPGSSRGGEDHDHPFSGPLTRRSEKFTGFTDGTTRGRFGSEWEDARQSGSVERRDAGGTARRSFG